MVALWRRWLVRSWRLLFVLGALAIVGVLAVRWLQYWNDTVRDVLETLSWIVALLTFGGLGLTWAVRHRSGREAGVSERERTDAPRPSPAPSVHNTLSGDMSGQAVQAGDVSGGIHFHPPAITPPDSGAVSAPADEVRLTGRVLHLRDGRLPKVSEVGLIAMRVKPAIESDTDTDAHQPPYVHRDVDAGLREVIAGGGMVLLHGRAAAGKSRAGLQAVRAVRADVALLVPRDGRALRDLVDAGLLDVGPLVVWLDDLERFLGPEGVDLGLLHRLCPAGDTRVSVVATMRDEVLSSYDLASTADRDNSSGTAVIAGVFDHAGLRLLEQLQGPRRIQVGQTLSPAEHAGAVRRAGEDPRIARALQAQEGFAEYLAAGVAMVRRWSVGDGPLFHTGQALISAAVDCRRGGLDTPLPFTLLEGLLPHYLPRAWRHRPELPSTAEAVSWACERVLGASSCLLPQEHRTYLASDYLLDHAQRGGSPLDGAPIPDTTWEALLTTATTSDQLFAVGVAANGHKNTVIAERVFRFLASDDTHRNTNAMTNLGVLLHRRDKTEAERWYRTAADHANTDAMTNLGTLLVERGEVAEAEHWWRTAIDHGNSNAMINLGVLLAEKDQAGVVEAERWYRTAIEHGNAQAMTNLGALLVERGEVAEAEHWWRIAIGHGNIHAMYNLGKLLSTQGKEVEAEQLYRMAADRGVILAMINLGGLLHRQGKVEAERWYRMAADLGNIHAMYNLGNVLVDRGEVAEAEHCFRMAADHGSTDAMTNLGSLLADRGEVVEAERWCRMAVDSGNVNAMANLGYLLSEQGNVVEAEYWYRIAIGEGSSHAMANFGALLAGQGQVVEAERWWRAAADRGNTDAMFNLGSLLAAQSEVVEAEHWWRIAAVDGNTHAIANLEALTAERQRMEDGEAG